VEALDQAADIYPMIAATQGLAPAPVAPQYPIEDAVKGVVLVDYEADGEHREGQLKLCKGDIIYVLEQDQSGWWGGHKEGDDLTGWFPSSIVQMTQPHETNAQGEPKHCQDDMSQDSSFSDEVSSPLMCEGRRVASPQARGRGGPQSPEAVSAIDGYKRQLEFDLASERRQRGDAEEVVASLRAQHSADIGRLEAKMDRMRADHLEETQQLRSKLKEHEARLDVSAVKHASVEKVVRTELGGDERVSSAQRSTPKFDITMARSEPRPHGPPASPHMSSPMPPKFIPGQPPRAPVVRSGPAPRPVTSPKATDGPPPAVRALVSAFENRTRTPSAVNRLRSKDVCAADGGLHTTPHHLEPPSRSVMGFRSRPAGSGAELDAADATRGPQGSEQREKDRLSVESSPVYGLSPIARVNPRTAQQARQSVDGQGQNQGPGHAPGLPALQLAQSSSGRLVQDRIRAFSQAH